MPNRVNLNDMSTVADPQTTFDWALWLPTVPGGNFSTRDFTFRAQTATVPALTVEEFQVEAQGIKSQWPGRRTWEMKMDTTIFETRDGVGRALVESWMEHIRSVKNNSGSLSADYAVTAELDLYDAPGAVTQRIALSRFYPLTLSAGTLDNTSALLTYTVGWSFDRSIKLPL